MLLTGIGVLGAEALLKEPNVMMTDHSFRQPDGEIFPRSPIDIVMIGMETKHLPV